MLEVQTRINLGRRDLAVPQKLLHRPQIAAGLQHMAGKRMPQHVWMHGHRQTGLQTAPFQTLPDGLRRQPRAVSAQK